MDTRSELLQCALELFAERGYDAVGVQEIVDAAGVTKPTMYHWFGSKRGLLEALFDAHFGALHERVERAADYRGDLVLTLETVLRAYLEVAAADPLFYRLQLAAWFAPRGSDMHQAMSARASRQQEVLTAMFARATREHGNMRGREAAYAATFLGMVNTYVGLALNGRIEPDDAMVYRAVHQYMHGILS